MGLIFMAMSAVSFSVMTMLVHVLASRAKIPSFEQVVFRCVVGIILSGSGLGGQPQRCGRSLGPRGACLPRERV